MGLRQELINLMSSENSSFNPGKRQEYQCLLLIQHKCSYTVGILILQAPLPKQGQAPHPCNISLAASSLNRANAPKVFFSDSNVSQFPYEGVSQLNNTKWCSQRIWGSQNSWEKKFRCICDASKKIRGWRPDYIYTSCMWPIPIHMKAHFWPSNHFLKSS